MLPPIVPPADLEISHQIKRQINAYKKINAYTHRASSQQILTLIAVVGQLIIHCVFMIRAIFAVDHALLYFIWALCIITFVCMAIDYFILTCGDPVDRLIQFPGQIQQWKIKEMNFDRLDIPQNTSDKRDDGRQENRKNPYQLKDCKVCNRPVKLLSYHCWTCKRCVEDMDHHCKYLNNCIGGRNYSSFFRLLSATSIYFCCSIAIGVWVFRVGFFDLNVDRSAYTKWMGLVFALVSLTCLIVVMILLGFHCYISCCLHMTTIQYIFRDTQSNNQSDSNVSSENTIKQTL